MNFPIEHLQWTREPKSFSVTGDRIEIVTNTHDGQQPDGQE